MAFRLKASDGSLEASVKRIAAEQLDKALASIESQGPDRAIHAVRERCKKMRALLRLVRTAFPNYAEENAFLRDTARLVSRKRDAYVIRETFAALTGEPAQIVAEPAQDISALLGECRLRLLAVKARTPSWSVDERGWDALSGGFTKTTRDARRAAKTARQHPDARSHHELRKQVKYHGFHCQILRPIKPRKLKRRVREAARLADALGRHHDLVLLTSHLTGAPTDFISVRRSHEILMKASNSSAALERVARRRARKLLAQRPRRLSKSLGKQWKTWAAEKKFEL